MNESSEQSNKVKNVIRNTHKNVKYIIWAERKLTREEMLKQIRYYNYTTINLKTRPGDIIEIEYDEDL